MKKIVLTAAALMMSAGFASAQPPLVTPAPQAGAATQMKTGTMDKTHPTMEQAHKAAEKTAEKAKPGKKVTKPKVPTKPATGAGAAITRTN